MRIGEVADAVSVPAQTIRFYERKGLLPQPRRGPNGYREYGGSTLNQLRFIRGAQSAGLSLVEIASILDLRGEGAVPSSTCSRCSRRSYTMCGRGSVSWPRSKQSSLR